MIMDEVFCVITYAIIIVKKCNMFHNNNITHIVMYTTMLYFHACIIDVCKHNIILFYKWDHMYPGWSL